MKQLQVTCLTKSFSNGKHGQVFAVDRVDLSLKAGECLGVVGESGSGKSTLSRLIAGLTAPDLGVVRLDQDHVTGPTRRIQMVFQSADEALNPAFSIRRNISVGLGRSLGDAGDQVREIAARVGLAEELLDRRPHQLSGGQQARAGIARALIAAPDVLVLDEPTAALDVSVQSRILKLIHNLRRETGCAMLFVSHDLDVVRLMCDRVLVLYRGRVVETGPVDALIGAPRHPYTQALVASMPGHGERSASALHAQPAEPRPDACHFRGACPLAADACDRERPVLRGTGHAVACHAAEGPHSGIVSESEAC